MLLSDYITQEQVLQDAVRGHVPIRKQSLEPFAIDAILLPLLGLAQMVARNQASSDLLPDTGVMRHVAAP